MQLYKEICSGINITVHGCVCSIDYNTSYTLDDFGDPLTLPLVPPSGQNFYDVQRKNTMATAACTISEIKRMTSLLESLFALWFGYSLAISMKNLKQQSVKGLIQT